MAADTREAARAVHAELGPATSARAFGRCLALELRERGLAVREQVPHRSTYRGLPVGATFRGDLVVEDLVLVELAPGGPIEDRVRARRRALDVPVAVLVDPSAADPDEVADRMPS